METKQRADCITDFVLLAGIMAAFTGGLLLAMGLDISIALIVAGVAAVAAGCTGKVTYGN